MFFVCLSLTFAQLRPTLLDEATIGDPASYDVGYRGFYASDGIYLVGTSQTLQGEEVTIFKVDENLNQIYQRTFGIGYVHDMYQHGDTLIIVGHAPNPNPTYSDDVCIVAFSMSSGDTLWKKWYGDSLVFDIPTSVCPNADGTGLAITYDKGYLSTSWIMNVGFDGTMIWSRPVDLGDNSRSIKLLSREDGYWLVDQVWRDNEQKIALARLSSDGSLISVTFFGFDSATVYANDAIIDGNGNIVVAGATEYGAIGGTDPMLLVFSPDGSYQRVISWGDMGEGALMSLHRLPGTGLMVFGWTITVIPPENFQITAHLFSEDLSLEGSTMFGREDADETSYGIFRADDWTVFGIGRTTRYDDVYLFRIGLENAIFDQKVKDMDQRLIGPTMVKMGQKIPIFGSEMVAVRDLAGREVLRLTPRSQWSPTHPGIYFINSVRANIKVIVY